MHGIHTVLAQQRRPTDSRSPARIDRTAARKSSEAPTIPREYIKHRSQHGTIKTALTASAPSARARRYGRSRLSARLELQNASRLCFRPGASQKHLIPYTRIPQLAALRITRTQCAHNRAVQPIRARQHESIALRLAKAAQRHNPTQAHYKQSSEHETALTVSAPSARA